MLHLASLRSGSSGNCVLLASRRTTLLMDFGLHSQKLCRQVLLEAAALTGRDHIDAVLVSHCHSDHIGYPGLRVLAERGIPVFLQTACKRYVRNSYGCRDWKTAPRLHGFESSTSFVIGDLIITPIDLPHSPDAPTLGYAIATDDGRCRAVLSTDFYSGHALTPHLAGADLVFIESNHCPELLKLFPNYASRFHMSNPRTAQLLRDALADAARPPRAVILGHLSDERNTPDRALACVRTTFEQDLFSGPIPFQLLAAPRHCPSPTVTSA